MIISNTTIVDMSHLHMNDPGEATKSANGTVENVHLHEIERGGQYYARVRLFLFQNSPEPCALLHMVDIFGNRARKSVKYEIQGESYGECVTV